jgi:hypothetical protein
VGSSVGFRRHYRGDRHFHFNYSVDAMKNDIILRRLDRLEETMQLALDRPMSVEETAKYLDTTPGVVSNLFSSGKLPRYKPNKGRVYTMKSDIDKFIRSGAIPTPAQLAEAARISGLSKAERKFRYA